MADLDDIEDMIGEEELSRAVMDATRAPMVAPKNAIGGGIGGSESVSAGTAASVPGTQLIWYMLIALSMQWRMTIKLLAND